MQNVRMLNNMSDVIHAIRNSLSRALPRKAFLFIQSVWKWLSVCLPNLVIFWVVKPTIEVRGFGGGDGASYLVEQLRNVNPLAPTKMCRVMTKYGSDKGYRWHNYTTVYSVLFKEWRDQPLRIFELGLGGNDPIVPNAGASLRGWRELFPNALVYGADIDRAALLQEDRIKTFYCDQLDQASIRELWSQPDLQGGMDIIIEDGLHTIEANVSFLESSLEQLRPGGIYVVEDIHKRTVDRWYDQLEMSYAMRYKTYEFALVVLPHYFNRLFNNLLVIRRGVSKREERKIEDRTNGHT
ncbi:MAG: hypothetical protein ACREDT_11540 [Methylocella sp.]